MNDYREFIFTKKESRRRVSKSVSLKYQHQTHNFCMGLLTCFIKYNDYDDSDNDLRILFMIQIK